MAANSAVVLVEHTVPIFINYLLDQNLKYDCYFIVGNEEKNIPLVRFGVVRKMLMAHSEVFRRELEESELKEEGDIKNPIPLTDTCPDTFTILLRYAYGWDTTESLCFEDADNLFYVAEKYMIVNLKNKLATRLKLLLTPDNVVYLMNNPAIYRKMDLHNAVTNILQYETAKVLASPQFLGLCSDGLLKILEQESLTVDEIELWRAALTWGKHNAQSEEGVEVRKKLLPHLKQLRLCSLNNEEFCRDVVPSNVLTPNEVNQIRLSIETKDKQDTLTEICSEVNPRGIIDMWKRSKLLKVDLMRIVYCSGLKTEEYQIQLITKQHHLNLVSFEFFTPPSMVDFTVTVTQLPTNNIVIIQTFNLKSRLPDRNTVSFSKDVLLQPNSVYQVTHRFHQPYPELLCHRFSANHSFDHFEIKYKKTKGDHLFSFMHGLHYIAMTG